MMDDCICAESDVPLAIADLTPPCASALLNDLIVCVNSKDVTSDSTTVPVVFACKESCSIVDNLLHDALYKSSQEQQSVINISSCSVQCRRCLMILGDAQFATMAADNKENDILAEDIESLQMLLSRVTVDPLSKTTVSQLTCRYMQHVVRIYNTSRFLLQGKHSDR